MIRLSKKEELIAAGVKYECVFCNRSDWQGKPLTLHVDHINGDRNDDKPSNRRFLCPNCHSQTNTYMGRNRTKYVKLGMVSPLCAHCGELKSLYAPSGHRTRKDSKHCSDRCRQAAHRAK